MKTLSKEDALLIELSLIPQELRDREAELYGSKWFDYRDLLPSHATKEFADKYDQVYREFYSRAFDYRLADRIKALLCTDIFAGNDLLPLWRARQAADRIGCKYEFYIRSVFSRLYERGWSRLPRPNQLYNEEIELDVSDLWNTARSAFIQMSDSTRFRAESYVGHPDQDAYYSYLIGEIKKREHPHLALASVVFKEKVLPADLAGEHFGSDVLARAKKFA